MVVLLDMAEPIGGLTQNQYCYLACCFKLVLLEESIMFGMTGLA